MMPQPTGFAVDMNNVEAMLDHLTEARREVAVRWDLEHQTWELKIFDADQCAWHVWECPSLAEGCRWLIQRHRKLRGPPQ